jgi:hypothetical protein
MMWTALPWAIFLGLLALVYGVGHLGWAWYAWFDRFG